VVREKSGHHPSPEQMQKLKEAYYKYTDPNIPQEERPTQEDLEKEYGISQAILSYWFNKFDQEGTETEEVLGKGASEKRTDRRTPPPGRDRFSIASQKVTAAEAIKSIGDLSREAYAKAINIGFQIVKNYGDLVDVALAKGAKIEDFVAEVFNCYEAKEQRERYTHDLELENLELRELTEQNYTFKRKSQCILDFAKECASLNKAGARINIKAAARALQQDLDRIDQEIEAKMEIKNQIEMKMNG